MKRSGTFIAVWLMALSAFAGDVKTKKLQVTTTATNAATTVSATTSDINGYIEAIWVGVPSGTPTGNVSVAYQPELAGSSAITLASKTGMTAATLYRPRVDTTDNAGSALTGDPPTRYHVLGEVVTFSISSANVTSQTWTVNIKYTK